MNPTRDVLEKRFAALEDGIAALAFAAGQAAITNAVETIAEADDNIVSAASLYGGTYKLFAHTLPQFSVGVHYADHREPASFARLIDAWSKAVYIESINNPPGIIADLERIAAIVHRHGVPLIKAGVTADTVRLSIGIEHKDDIAADLTQALAAV